VKGFLQGPSTRETRELSGLNGKQMRVIALFTTINAGLSSSEYHCSNLPKTPKGI
jgi:hypothetical protein